MKTNHLTILLATIILSSCTSSKAQNIYPCEIFQTPAGKELRAYMICHGSIALSYNGYEIQIDPVSKYADRNIDYALFPKADAIFVSHDHFDHLDTAAISQLRHDNTRILANKESAAQITGSEVVKNNDKIQLNDNILVTIVPAYNTTAGHLQFHPKGYGNGFLFNFDGLIVYVSGDTEHIDEMNNMGKVDIAFLSTNQPYTMTPAQCVQAAQAIQPQILIPYHLGDTQTADIENGLKNTKIKVKIFEELR